MIQVLSSTQANIKLAAEQIKQNNIVAFPTETVYGLGGSAYSNTAIDKIYQYKNRPLHNPLIAHYASLDHIAEDCIVNDLCKIIYKKFMPGPLTVILKKKNNSHLVPMVSANLPTQGVRVPNHKTALALIHYASLPIAAPSANISNKISPTLPEHVVKSFSKENLILLDDGASTLGLESTIVDISNNKNLTILRHGYITLEDLQSLNIPIVSQKEEKILASGMLKKHYSPNTPLELSCEKLQENDGLLAFGEINFVLPKNVAVYNLSPKKNLQEAAKNLFKALWELDAKGLTRICVMPIPNVGLGMAINEKLQKAAYKE